MALGEHYLITQRGEVVETNHPVQNAWVYEMTAGVGTFNDLGLAWLEDVWPAYKALSTNHYHLIELYIVNLDDVDDFGTIPVDEVGTVDSASLPSYDTWGFKLIRVSRATQNGKKFIGLIGETDQDNGAPVAGALSRLAAMEVALNATINAVSTSPSFTPRIWRRPGTYAGGAVAAPGSFFPIDSAVFTKITTFKTRDDQ